MGEPQQLTLGEVEAVVRPLLGPVVSARLLEQKHRNQVFAVGDDAIFKAYLWDGVARQARKVATLRCLEGRGLPCRGWSATACWPTGRRGRWRPGSSPGMSGRPGPSWTPRTAGSFIGRSGAGCPRCTPSAGSPALAPG